MDMFKQMMEMQEHLNTNVINKLKLRHYNPSKVSHDIPPVIMNRGNEHLYEDAVKRDWSDNFMSALQAEVCEVREALTTRVKWWKNKTKDQAGVEDELVDCLHFLMSGMLAMGMTAEDVYNRYCEKNKQNFERKDWDVNNV